MTTPILDNSNRDVRDVTVLRRQSDKGKKRGFSTYEEVSPIGITDLSSPTSTSTSNEPSAKKFASLQDVYDEAVIWSSPSTVNTTASSLNCLGVLNSEAFVKSVKDHFLTLPAEQQQQVVAVIDQAIQDEQRMLEEIAQLEQLEWPRTVCSSTEMSIAGVLCRQQKNKKDELLTVFSSDALSQQEKALMQELKGRAEIRLKTLLSLKHSSNTFVDPNVLVKLLGKILPLLTPEVVRGMAPEKPSDLPKAGCLHDISLWRLSAIGDLFQAKLLAKQEQELEPKILDLKGQEEQWRKKVQYDQSVALLQKELQTISPLTTQIERCKELISAKWEQRGRQRQVQRMEDLQAQLQQEFTQLRLQPHVPLERKLALKNQIQGVTADLGALYSKPPLYTEKNKKERRAIEAYLMQHGISSNQDVEAVCAKQQHLERELERLTKPESMWRELESKELRMVQEKNSKARHLLSSLILREKAIWQEYVSQEHEKLLGVSS